MLGPPQRHGSTSRGELCAHGHIRRRSRNGSLRPTRHKLLPGRHFPIRVAAMLLLARGNAARLAARQRKKNWSGWCQLMFRFRATRAAKGR